MEFDTNRRKKKQGETLDTKKILAELND